MNALPMRLMLPALLLCALARPGAAAVAAHGADLDVTDTTPAFWRFWDAARGRSEDDRVTLFMDRVVAAHPELFEPGVLNSAAVAGSPPPADAGAIVTRYLHDIEPDIAAMRRLSASLRRDLKGYAQDFQKTFPDYAARTPVIFTISLQSFDGATRDIDGHTVLLFAIDGIARYHPPGSNLKVFFDHELFHQYRDQVAPGPPDDATPLWMSLWEEGLATWISQQMNAGSTLADALMSPTLAGAAAPRVPGLARELLDNFASTDEREYAAFFFGSNDRHDLPPRCGYYVGYRVAQQLAAGRTLRELAVLQGADLETAVRQALQSLASTP